EDEEIIKSINETPTQKAAKRRKLSEEAQEANDLKKRSEIVQDDDDDVFVEATPLAQKVPIVDYQVVVIDNKPRYKIKRADDTHQLYISFTALLKNFDREDLEALWKIDTEIEGRQADKQAEIYNIDLDHSSKVLSMQEDDTEVQESVEVVTTAKLITEVVTAAGTQVVAASTPIFAAKPKVLKITAAPTVSTRKRKGVVIRDPEEELHIDTPAKTPTVKDKGKGILIEDPKPIKKKDQIEMDAEEEMDKEDEEIIKSINETPTQKAAKRRKLSEEAQEADDLKKRLEIVQDKDDDVFVEATPLAQKVPIVDYQVVVIDNKPRYKIIRADDTQQFYISFTTLLKNFDREDLETL
nr:hypothetical protein [Tanacetum cinerariifolium]